MSKKMTMMKVRCLILLLGFVNSRYATAWTAGSFRRPHKHSVWWAKNDRVSVPQLPRSTSSSYGLTRLHSSSSTDPREKQVPPTNNETGPYFPSRNTSWMISTKMSPSPATPSSPDESLSPSQQQALLEQYLWYFPPLLSFVSFFSYQPICVAFHNLIDVASGHRWVAADGGAYMSEIMQKALSGPVTFSISILFGTLVGLTVSSLYNRQMSIHRSIVGMLEEARELELFIEGFPEPHKRRCTRLIRNYLEKVCACFDQHDVTPASLRKDRELSTLTLKLNDLVRQPNGEAASAAMIVGEAYGSLGRLKNLRVDLLAALSTSFAMGHYATLLILAGTLLVVFLLETDNNAMQYLLDFQLSICWALLIGAYSLLAVVIFDLNTPFSGIFSTVRASKVDMDMLREYAFRIDHQTNDAAQHHHPTAVTVNNSPAPFRNVAIITNQLPQDLKP